MAEHAQQANSTVINVQGEANKVSRQNFGESEIYPGPGELIGDKIKISTGSLPREEFDQPIDLPGDTKNDFNQGTTRFLEEKIQEQDQKAVEARETLYSRASEEKVKAKNAIKVESDKTTLEQSGIKENAAIEVNNYRQEWQDENQEVLAKFQEKSRNEHATILSKIDEKVEKTGEKIDSKIKVSDKIIQEQTAKTSRQAEKTKKEKEPGFFEKASQAVSDFFNKIKAKVIDLFNKLRFFR